MLEHVISPIRIVNGIHYFFFSLWSATLLFSTLLEFDRIIY